MATLLIATALFGLVLGRFFKVYILIPTCVIALALALAGPTLGFHSLPYSFMEVILVLASLQIGYFIALASRNLPSIHLNRSRIWGASTQPAPSRPLHLR